MNGTFLNASKLVMSSGCTPASTILSWKNSDFSYISRTFACRSLSCIFSSSSLGIVSISSFQNAMFRPLAVCYHLARMLLVCARVLKGCDASSVGIQKYPCWMHHP